MSAANPVTLPLADYKARSIRLAVDGKVATITLDRPDKKKSMSVLIASRATKPIPSTTAK